MGQSLQLSALWAPQLTVFAPKKLSCRWAHLPLAKVLIFYTEHLLFLRTHPRALPEVARHSQSPLHQRYLSEKHRWTSSFIVKKKHFYFMLDFLLLSRLILFFPNPLPSGHSVQEAARWPPQFTVDAIDKCVRKWKEREREGETNLRHRHFLNDPLRL